MINRVTVRGFRGISGTEVFAPEILTVLTGRNGLGKTTFFDAVDWCLFGEASRLGSQAGLIKNLYRPETRSSVEVVLKLGDETVSVTRTENGVTLNGASVSERELAEALIVDPEVFPPYLRELGRQVRTVTYLPQEQIREFVTASLTSERKALLRGLLGVPNAGIVESSIKRVTEHFSVREKNLIEETENLNNELHQLATDVDFDPRVERDAKEFLTTFRERYGNRSDTIDNLRSALEENLAKRENDAAQVDSTSAAHSQTLTTIAQADKEIVVLEERRAELLNHSADTQSKIREITASIDKTLLARQDATKEMVGQEARVTNLSLIFSNKERTAVLTEQLIQCGSERDAVVAKTAVLDKSTQSLRLELAAAEKLADEHRVQLKLAQERATIESLRTSIQNQLSRLQDERGAKEAQLNTVKQTQAAISKELVEALAAKDRASVSHGQALQSAQRAAQVADLREKLINLIDIGDSHCPLCGAEYETHERLFEHLRRTAGVPDIDRRLQNASSALSAAETLLQELTAHEKLHSAEAEKQRADLEQLDRDLAKLSTQYDSSSVSLQQLGEPGEPKLSSEVLVKVSELRTNLEETDRLRSQLERDLRSVEDRRGRVASELEELKRTRADSLPDVSVEIISEARQRVSETRKAIDEHEQVLRTLRNTQAQIESLLSDTRSQIAAVEGRLNAERDRKRRVIEDFDRQRESVGLVGVDLQETGNKLQVQARFLQTEIAEIRNAIGRAKAIERRQIINENAAKQHDRQKRLAEAQESLSVLREAQNRFYEIAKDLTARSKIEAESAGALHLGAIQECFNDLYPHRHLNEVEVNFAEGELLVKDRWLTKGVRPQDYSSTGQANVLALSVFLGLALRQTFSLGRFLLLDEPVQNLDDLHFLAFLTLLKRVASSRQVIISTADSNIAEILRKQLRSWSAKNRTWCEYEWVAFEPKTGPTIKRRESKQMAVA
jgi:DNA repair exonuclease SbcCD ATPase subunit